jgi:hypothetical protein
LSSAPLLILAALLGSSLSARVSKTATNARSSEFATAGWIRGLRLVFAAGLLVLSAGVAATALDQAYDRAHSMLLRAPSV